MNFDKIVENVTRKTDKEYIIAYCTNVYQYAKKIVELISDATINALEICNKTRNRIVIFPLYTSKKHVTQKYVCCFRDYDYSCEVTTKNMSQKDFPASMLARNFDRISIDIEKKEVEFEIVGVFDNVIHEGNQRQCVRKLKSIFGNYYVSFNNEKVSVTVKESLFDEYFV